VQEPSWLPLLPSSAVELGGEHEREPRERGEERDLRRRGDQALMVRGPTRESCARAPQRRRWTTCRE